MELAAAMATAGVTLAVSSINALMIHRQKMHIQQIEQQSTVSMQEANKLIREKDEVVTHLYQLYTIVNELDQVLSSILSPSYFSDNPVCQKSMRSATFYSRNSEEKSDVSSDIYRRTSSGVGGDEASESDRGSNASRMFHMTYSLHMDVNAYLYALALLFRWIEVKNSNRTAVHALHSGALHTLIEQTSRLLHSTCYQRMRVPLILQKGIGQQMIVHDTRDNDVQDSDEAPRSSGARANASYMLSDNFCVTLRAWKHTVYAHDLQRVPAEDTLPVSSCADEFGVSYYMQANSDAKRELTAIYTFCAPFSRVTENTQAMLESVEHVKRQFVATRQIEHFVVKEILRMAMKIGRRRCPCTMKAAAGDVLSICSGASTDDADAQDRSTELPVGVRTSFMSQCKYSHRRKIKDIRKMLNPCKSTRLSGCLCSAREACEDGNSSPSHHSIHSKIISVFVPVLFACYLDHEGLGEVVRLSEALKKLLLHTDRVILGDCDYRQKLISMV
jgi:hypothetical protein